MLNAIEIFTAQSLDEFSTAVEEVKIYILYNVNAVYAIENIKSLYEVKKVWSGDPCAPRLYPWEGVGCIYNNNNHHIKSLNLSSSGLQGPIVKAFRNLSLLESLDLSNNDLQHNVPEFLADLKHLKSLNLKGNNFTGVIPKSLMKKWQEGLLALSVDDKNRCNSSSCQEKKKNNMVVPIAAATSVIVLLVVLVIIWIILRQRKRGEEFWNFYFTVINLKLVFSEKKKCLVSGADAGPGPIPPPGKRRFGENAGPGPLLPSGKRRFTYDEVSSITNNFNKVIGKGGFGIVYLGSLEDGAKIAVKMIKDSLSTIPNVTSSSSSSTRASKEFQTEAELLLTVHHKNLASFVGYCDDERSTALIYEYMANGNLQDYLSSEKAEDLSWEKRLHIAIDAAQGWFPRYQTRFSLVQIINNFACGRSNLTFFSDPGYISIDCGAPLKGIERDIVTGISYTSDDDFITTGFKNASEKVFKEILTYTESEFLYVCLVNKGKGTPFISGLELRPVNSSIYNTEYGRNVSLVLYQRWDIGYLNGTGRYQNDVYDRIWSPYTPVSWNSIRTTGYIDVFQSGYSPPDEVIKTAASPKSEDDPMELSWTSDDTNARFYAYLYFAELETLKANESRKMEIWWNGSPFQKILSFLLLSIQRLCLLQDHLLVIT
ncbi:hypothetical protein Bca52824_089201 [Brassica carinata]|uniref:non-specific serine/threonine protein kinase n=1 Tax=Brassica carinata TaxID=52824 RepID=A0A8X7PF57_BRACI|nr:hypothetical protein Bca52824_089201 [Brassica carinata]